MCQEDIFLRKKDDYIVLTVKEIHHLYLLSEASSVVEAAAKGGVSASAISQSLSSIESKLGAQLFIRRRGGLSPTGAGLAAIRRVSTLLNELQALTVDIDALVQGAKGVLQFGIGPAVASLFLNDTVAELFTKYGRYVPRFEVAFWTSCEEKLISREIDLFIGGFASPPKDDRFEFIPFYTDTMVAVTHKAHPILELPAITLEDLIRYPVMGFNSSIETWKSLSSTDALEMFERNVPASMMPEPLQFLPVIGHTHHIVVVPELNWRAVQEQHPDIIELQVERLRGTAQMYFVKLAGAELPECYEHLLAVFKSQLATKRQAKAI